MWVHCRYARSSNNFASGSGVLPHEVYGQLYTIHNRFIVDIGTCGIRLGWNAEGLSVVIIRDPISQAK